ncbi:MAG TPA: alpha/beta hydrolase [Gaiellaceae bacterium]
MDVVFHHGTPSLGRVYAPWEEDGIRLVGFDRSGYGDAPRRPGRSIADVVEEVVAVADAHGFDRFATWGISGGGPHALACAALLPDRVTACAAIGSPAPRGAEALDWYADFGEGNVSEFRAAEHGEAALRALVEQDDAADEAAGPAGLRDALASLTSPVDAAVLDGPLLDYLWGIMRGAAVVDGWVDDDLAFVRPWGFDLGSIRVPVLIRHGEQDRFVPPAHARWLAEQIPGAELQLTADDGHLTLYEHGIPGVHDWLRRPRG